MALRGKANRRQPVLGESHPFGNSFWGFCCLGPSIYRTIARIADPSELSLLMLQQGQRESMGSSYHGILFCLVLKERQKETVWGVQLCFGGSDSLCKDDPYGLTIFPNIWFTQDST